MTASTTTIHAPGFDVARRRRLPLVATVADTLAITGRNLIAYRRIPQLLVFSTIQPVIFVLLFRYVFGGAIAVRGASYVDYLRPGIFVQTVVVGSVATAIGLDTDVKSGLLERFRSLPMARSAVLTGRTLADLVRNFFVVLLMAAVGYLAGFRIHTNAGAFIAGVGLILLFSWAISWVFATVGLILSDPESAQAAAFPVMAPLVFASSAFVPVASMPSWLQGFANHQPVSVTAYAVRGLVLGDGVFKGLGLTGDTAAYALQSLAWSAVIILVCAPLAVWRYRRAL